MTFDREKALSIFLALVLLIIPPSSDSMECPPLTAAAASARWFLHQQMPGISKLKAHPTVNHSAASQRRHRHQFVHGILFTKHYSPRALIFCSSGGSSGSIAIQCGPGNLPKWNFLFVFPLRLEPLHCQDMGENEQPSANFGFLGRQEVFATFSKLWWAGMKGHRKQVLEKNNSRKHICLSSEALLQWHDR